MKEQKKVFQIMKANYEQSSGFSLSTKREIKFVSEKTKNVVKYETGKALGHKIFKNSKMFIYEAHLKSYV